MKYCSTCGSKLIEKETKWDGPAPFCPVCNDFRFPTFNSAISSVIFNKEKDKILLIQQYGSPSNILVAGYINKGENANEALYREMKEEVNLNIASYLYNDNLYFEKSNTLIHNFITVVEKEDFTLTDEVDDAHWFPIQEAITQVKPKSLAKYFLFQALHKMNLSEALFIYEDERIYMLDDKDALAAEICFPWKDDHYEINKTFVSDKLRGLKIASKLMQAAVDTLNQKESPYTASCSYAIKWLEKHQ